MTTHSHPGNPPDEHARLRDQLQGAVGDRYRIERPLGEGGMAVVFLAEDTRHHRPVAIKVLQEELAHTIGVQRFLQEIEVIARLQHPHLLTLIDSGDVAGLPFYVMPFVEGQSLRELIAREGRLSVDRALSIAREIAEGLQYAHEHGVVHRDIKPSNILMSGGHAVVADFGIATALSKASAGRLTETGISLGSPTYMSPEQAAGERDLGPTTDVYSLACVLYEMLAGEPPIDGGSMQQIVTRKLTGQHVPLGHRRRDLPANTDAVLTRALAVDSAQRYSTMREFIDALAPARTRIGPRRRLAVAAAVAVPILLLAAFLSVRQEGELEAVRALADAERLAREGRYTSAYALLARHEARAPDDSLLQHVRGQLAEFVNIRTIPAGARVFRRRLGDADSTWYLMGTTPLDSAPVPRFGWEQSYLLRVEADGHAPRYALPMAFSHFPSYRGVKPLDPLVLIPAGSPDTGMVMIPGFAVRDSRPGTGTDSLRFQPFLMDKREVTNAEFKRFVDARGYERPEFWTEPFVRAGSTLRREQALALFRDATGLPGPATWANGTYEPDREHHPVSGVSWYEAAAYARFVGKQLPTSTHYFRGALLHHRDAAFLYMASANIGGRDTRPVGLGVVTPLGLSDVAGNVREWCVNEIDEGRLTRGAAFDDQDFHVGNLVSRDPFDRSPGNGFRLVKLTDHDTLVSHLSRRLSRALPREFAKEQPAADAEFAIFRRMYDYDKVALSATTEAEGVGEAFRWEKVSFMGPAGDRMGAYVLLPRRGLPPYQAIVLWPGSGALWTPVFDPPTLERGFGFLTLSGRALVVPLLTGTWERDDSLFSISSHPAAGSARERDLTVLWHKEIRRVVDYLESRADIQDDAIGFYGHSWGGREAGIALAVEPRFRAAVLKVGGFRPTRVRREIDAVHYVPRVRTPTLMLNGRHDVIFPYATAQVPFFQMLGTPPSDKKHVVYEGGHAIPASESARETLAWLDRYIGAPSRNE